MSNAPSADQLAAYGQDATATRDSLSGGDLLTQISNVVREIMQARSDVRAKEEELKVAQTHQRTLEEITLPDLMRQAKQEKLRTTDGYDVELSDKIRASIPPARQSEAFMWLTANGQGAIIKRELKLAFGKEEDQKAAQAYDMIVEAGFAPNDKQFVHPQTLEATVREMMANGVDVPHELLGIYIQPLVKIKEAKR